eukprot:Skav233535  [mRNA]  locus=scaffold5919:14070:21104:+ [translate_table: standard]
MVGAARHCLLLRHGTPVPQEEDSQRPLSEQGRSEAASSAKKVVAYLTTAETREAFLGHSGKLRAAQTAELVAGALRDAGWTVACEEVVGLSPKDEASLAMPLLSSPKAPVVVLVGHLPHMGQFAAAMLESPAAAGRLGGLFHPVTWAALIRCSWGDQQRLWRLMVAATGAVDHGLSCSLMKSYRAS